MPIRKPSTSILVSAVTMALLAVSGGVYAEAAAIKEPPSPKPASPRGPKAVFQLNGFEIAATDNVALRWSDQTLRLIRGSTLPPTAVSRVLAVVQTSVYDAWAAYDPVAVGTRLGGTLRRPAAEHKDNFKSEAISYAAYHALVDLFPTKKDDIRAFMVSLGYTRLDYGTPAGALAAGTPAAIGIQAATAVLDFRHGDGANQGGGYADTTGHVPVNTHDNLVDRWHWQPLWVPGAPKPQSFATPHWRKVTPFALTGPEQFPLPGPDLRKDYKKAVDDIVKYSAQLSDEDKAKAEYWSDGPSSELPPGHGAIFAEALCKRSAGGLDSDVKMLFLQANAVLDAGIAAWHAKWKYDFVRPITLVRTLKAGERIRAWGGPSKGTVWMNGEDWKPYQASTFVTPPFPEYVSGHSTFSAATFTVLRMFTGTDRLDFSVTIAPGKSQIERDVTPKKAVTLGWKTMQAAAAEAGESRRLGGIHFEDGDLHGQTLGDKVGQAVFQKAQTYFNGTATS